MTRRLTVRQSCLSTSHPQSDKRTPEQQKKPKNTTMSATSTLSVENSPDSSSQKYPPETSSPLSSYTLKRRPWRLAITPFEDVMNHRYSGGGTETDPWIVDWIPNDPEDPQNWKNSYKWITIVNVSVVTLAVALSSSAYSGGIEDLMIEFGCSAELATAGICMYLLSFFLPPSLIPINVPHVASSPPCGS